MQAAVYYGVEWDMGWDGWVRFTTLVELQGAGVKWCFSLSSLFLCSCLVCGSHHDFFCVCVCSVFSPACMYAPLFVCVCTSACTCVCVCSCALLCVYVPLARQGEIFKCDTLHGLFALLRSHQEKCSHPSPRPGRKDIFDEVEG